MTVEVNGTTATSTNTSISGNTLAKGAFTEVKVTISYAENGARADGPFTVEFGGISLDYSTVDGANLISFRIDYMTFYAEEGMTWEEWLESDYNTEGMYVSDTQGICTNHPSHDSYVYVGSLTEPISSETEYEIRSGCINLD